MFSLIYCMHKNFFLLLLFSFLFSACGFGASPSPTISLDTPLYSDDEEENGRIMKHVYDLTDSSQLAEYAKSPNQGVRAYVAANIHTPVETLKVLSKDESPIVRQYLGTNRSVSADILKTLSQDDSFEVRGTISKNPTTPEEVLKVFIDDVEHVQELLVNNTNLSEDLMLQIVDEMKNPRSLEVFAKRGDLPESVKEALRNSEFESVRNAVDGIKSSPMIPDGNIQVQTE
jgi:hypothetical protein